MKPEVLFWALFFVVAVGLVFRAFTRSSRRETHIAGDPETLLKAPNETAAGHAAPTMKTPEPAHFTPAHIDTKPAPPALSERVQPSVPPPPTYEMPPPAPAIRSATAAPANAARERAVIVGPDVKATLHPDAITNPYKAIVAPSIKATLPPAPVPTSEALIARPDVKATLPPAPGVTPTAPSVARVVEPTLPSATSLKAVTESPEILSPSPEPDPVATPTTIRLRGTRLRARRIGQAMPPLDERIKESRSRKIRGRLKTRRKHKPLPKAPRKAPARRIAAAPDVDNTFISAKATTKIVGAPPKPLRVRLAANP